MNLAEADIRRLCAQLLTGQAQEPEALDDELVRAEVKTRLEACGVRLLEREGSAPLCLIEQGPEDLPELALACLALCAVALGTTNGTRKRARISVTEIWERVGKRSGYTEAFLRRAGLGPLETRGLIKVVKPAQRAADAYVVAGPALVAVDSELIMRRIRTL